MYIVDELVKLYFFHVSPDMILKERINYMNFPRKEFAELMFCYRKEYSETESYMIYENMKISDRKNSGNMENNLHVFCALENVVSEILTIQENEVRCNYEQIHRWRELTRIIGEELPVCAFFLNRYRTKGIPCDWFEWDTVLGHTNGQLNAVMRRGISDNHFHLFGSAPIFPLVWIKLMNNVNMNEYIKGLQGIEGKKRNLHYHFDKEYGENTTSCMILQAALMRAVMCFCLNEGSEIDEKSCTVVTELLAYLRLGERIGEVQEEIRHLVNLLKAKNMIRLQADMPDYAICDTDDGNLNWIFTGERRLVYEMLVDIQVTKKLPKQISNLLYPYLVIRTILRGEIVQNNDNIGFENFSVYSKRKNGFLTGIRDTERMVIHAVRGSFQQQNLRTLEIRITPMNNYLEDARQIHYYDNLLMEKDDFFDKKDGLRAENFFYVYHFSKESDKSRINEEHRGLKPIPCRNAELRKKNKIKGNAILELRKRMPSEASRIRGIDACAQEIGCRPEVFAPVFRKLKNHVASFSEAEVKQLKQTYHVGEDFLDVVDGLRAINEAVCFLDMRRGDRLGHATALGISVREWYETKQYIVNLSEQDYLDNVVWLYHKLWEFEIPDMELLKGFLLDEYHTYFYRIYETNLKITVSGGITSYYDAWKLRGDMPELYRTQKYMPDSMILSEEYPISESFPENPKIRDKEEVAFLYWAYHYSNLVRVSGNWPLHKQVPQIYVDGVEKVQKAMQYWIAQKGIGIETNPSSNLAISTMKNYEEHTILNFYNLGLNRMNTSECPQLQVSINTDDKGVFHTSLENEYALIASALESMKDEDGKPKFKAAEVYEWVDHIRILGNEQAF